MKKLIAILALALPIAVSAQTNAPTKVLPWLEDVGANLGNSTNYSFAPYLTYAPDAPRKYGAGLLAVYNVNENVGIGTGIDWLGQFNLVSGNVTLKVPTRPLTFVGLTNFVATPFAIAGLGTPVGGADTDNGNISTIAGAGLSLTFTRWKGWDIGGGYAYNNWTGAGDFSGQHHNIFLKLSKGF